MAYADAAVCAAFLDGLGPAGVEEADPVNPQYLPQLARYLIGHPQGLVSGRRTGGKGKGGKRYFVGDGRSEDVMADKVVTGCWACGKLDHDSHACVFKRCFVCSEQGHEFSDCTKRSAKCDRCGRSGHWDDFCPEAAYDEGLQNDADVFRCRCVKCNEEGHLNCGAVPAAGSTAPAPRAGGGAPGPQLQPRLRPPLRPTLRPAPLLPGQDKPLRRVVIAPAPPRPSVARGIRLVPWEATGGEGDARAHGRHREGRWGAAAAAADLPEESSAFRPAAWGPQPPGHPPPWWRGPPLVSPRRPGPAGAAVLRRPPGAAAAEAQVRYAKRRAEPEPDWDVEEEREDEEGPLQEEDLPSCVDDWPDEADDADGAVQPSRSIVLRGGPGAMAGAGCAEKAARQRQRGGRKYRRQRQ